MLQTIGVVAERTPPRPAAVGAAAVATPITSTTPAALTMTKVLATIAKGCVSCASFLGNLIKYAAGVLGTSVFALANNKNDGLI